MYSDILVTPILEDTSNPENAILEGLIILKQQGSHKAIEWEMEASHRPFKQENGVPDFLGTTILSLSCFSSLVTLKQHNFLNVTVSGLGWVPFFCCDVIFHALFFWVSITSITSVFFIKGLFCVLQLPMFLFTDWHRPILCSVPQPESQHFQYSTKTFSWRQINCFKLVQNVRNPRVSQVKEKPLLIPDIHRHQWSELHHTIPKWQLN